jgi:AraC-like DNA-binding protein
MPSQNIPLDWALKVLVGAVRKGISQDYLLSQSYIERKFGDHRDRISHAQYILLCLNAAVYVEDALQDLGSKRMEIGFAPLTVRIVHGCRTLEDAINALSNFFHVAGPSLQVGLRVDHDEAEMTMYADSSDLESAYTLEANHTNWLSLCLSHFLGRKLPLIGITTRDPNHISLHSSHWALGVPVSPGSITALRFPTTLLAARRVGSAGRHAYLDCIRSNLEASERNTLSQWGDVIGQKGPPPKISELAFRAGVSSSTIRRRFDQDGGFRLARQRTIVEAAVGVLQTSNACVDSIAMDFGYADARSFRRFIKRATGKTPQELRAGDQPAPQGTPHEPIYRRIRELAISLDA